MKILLTGAGGFLGRHIIEKSLNNKNINVIAMSSREELQNVQESNVFFLSNTDAFNIKWNDIDVLINCAFPRNVEGKQMTLGLDFTMNVLEKAAKDGVGSIINISSQSVYGSKRTEVANECTMLNLESKYAVGKYAVELMTNCICKGVRHTNIRLASLIGPGFEQRLVNKFVKQSIEEKKLNLIGGKQRYGFLDVRDAAQGIIKLAQNDDEWDEIYNLGIMNGYSMLEIARCVQNVCMEHGVEVSINLEQTDDWTNSEMNCRRIYRQLNWMPEYTLKKTIEDIYISYSKENVYEHMGDWKVISAI